MNNSMRDLSMENSDHKMELPLDQKWPENIFQPGRGINVDNRMDLGECMSGGNSTSAFIGNTELYTNGNPKEGGVI